MSKVKSLRAADLGYTWAPWLPDGATWTRDEDGTVDLWQTPKIKPIKDVWDSERGYIADEDRQWLGLTPPDFGDRPWQECILIKGQEPPEPAKPDLPPCPEGEGWVEWSGGECPVPNTVVWAQLRIGECLPLDTANSLRWSHDWGQRDIIRYRVHQPKKYRPYTRDELAGLVGKVLRRKSGTVAMVGMYRPSHGYVIMAGGDLVMWYAGGLLDEWRIVDGTPDGSPCGVEVSDD